MSTSAYGYIVATDTTLVGADKCPVGPVSSYAIVNNACHLADEFAQVRVAWASEGTYFGATTNGATILLASFVFPITLRQSGDSYRFRIRLGGYYAGGASATATLRAVIGNPGSTGALRGWGGAGDREFVTASLGTSSAWVTGTSQGTNAWTDMIYLPSALVNVSQFNTPKTFGGADTATDVPFAQLSVYGTSNSAATHYPILTGVYCAEVIGA